MWQRGLAKSGPVGSVPVTSGVLAIVAGNPARIVRPHFEGKNVRRLRRVVWLDWRADLITSTPFVAGFRGVAGAFGDRCGIPTAQLRRRVPGGASSIHPPPPAADRPVGARPFSLR